jgi:hypothetical protein
MTQSQTSKFDFVTWLVIPALALLEMAPVFHPIAMARQQDGGGTIVITHAPDGPPMAG